MEHAESELSLGFTSGWEKNRWCSSLPCQDLNWQELPAAPRWCCWAWCARSVSCVCVLWIVLLERGMYSRQVAFHSPALCSPPRRLSHLARSCPNPPHWRQCSASPPTLQPCHWNHLPDWGIPRNALFSVQISWVWCSSSQSVWQEREWMREAVLFLNSSRFHPW